MLYFIPLIETTYIKKLYKPAAPPTNLLQTAKMADKVKQAESFFFSVSTAHV